MTAATVCGFHACYPRGSESQTLFEYLKEEFIKRLAAAGHRETSHEQRDTVEYRHLGTLSCSWVIVQHVFEPRIIQPLRLSNTKSSRSYVVCPPTLSRLHPRLIRSEIIPQPISVAAAFERRQAKERELLEDTPAISSTSTYIPSFVTSTGLALTNAQKGKTKAKATANGKTKPPQPKTSSMTKRQKEKAERQKANSAEITETETTGATSASASTSSRTTRKPSQETQKLPGPVSQHEPKPEVEPNGLGPNGQNGFPPIPSPPWSIHPIHPHVVACPPFPNGGDLPPPLPPSAQHFMGPASGFLQDPRLPFGGENPGRTIYSQR